jgi:adenylate kinase family enzyme
MGLPILVLGKSGSGKSTSLRNFGENEVGIMNVLGKPFPFKNNLKYIKTDDYAKIKALLLQSKVNSLVIDDAGYLITNQFMRGHSGGKGGQIFELYNSLGDNFWQLIQFIIHELPNEKIVYLFMHEEKNDMGDVKPKTIGKMLDDKVCIEGMFTIVLRALKEDGKYVFATQSNGFDVTKTPIDMFKDEKIDNDLKLVDTTVRTYYNL